MAARRNPLDPRVRIGEELAAARALSDLAHKLFDVAANAIERFEGPLYECTRDAAAHRSARQVQASRADATRIALTIPTSCPSLTKRRPWFISSQPAIVGW